MPLATYAIIWIISLTNCPLILLLGPRAQTAIELTQLFQKICIRWREINIVRVSNSISSNTPTWHYINSIMLSLGPNCAVFGLTAEQFTSVFSQTFDMKTFVDVLDIFYVQTHGTLWFSVWICGLFWLNISRDILNNHKHIVHVYDMINDTIFEYSFWHCTKEYVCDA